jgi:hypothetical protein
MAKKKEEKIVSPETVDIMAATLKDIWDYFHPEPGLMYGPGHPSHKVAYALANYYYEKGIKILQENRREN